MRIKWGTVRIIFAVSLALIFGGSRYALGQQISYSGSYPADTTIRGTNTSSTDGSTGVHGVNNSSTGVTNGVAGTSASSSGRGVAGWATAPSGTNYGVVGGSASPNGIGVYGVNNIETGYNYGVYGKSAGSAGIGVAGWATAPTGTTYGLYGVNYTNGGAAVFGYNTSYSGIAVQGTANTTTGTSIAVLGASASPSGYGVYGVNSAGGYGGFFWGNVHVTGTLSKSAGSFKIDHPLDPENKYLEHSFVESPDMMNIYNGSAKLDEKGEMQVTMPDYFEALNRDFQYQLTAIGASAPGLFIQEEIKNGKFKIAGGKPGMKVSWQVTGVRNDTYAKANRIKVVENKPDGERGKLMWDPVASKQRGNKGELPQLASREIGVVKR